MSHWLLFVYLFFCDEKFLTHSPLVRFVWLYCRHKMKQIVYYVRQIINTSWRTVLSPQSAAYKTLAACTVTSGTYNKVLTYFRVYNFATFFAVLPSLTQILNYFEFHPHSAWQRSSHLHETYQCRMYSRKLLMMGREDARNMLRINLNN
jgi:hypothetical protein